MYISCAQNGWRKPSKPFAAAPGVEPDAQQSFVNYNFEHDSIFFAPPRLQTTLMDDSFLEIGTWYGRASSQIQILPMVIWGAFFGFSTLTYHV